MECYERGLITEEDTGGRELNWGDSDLIIKLVELIGKREGFGWLLGEGVKRAAEKIGGGAEDIAVHVKGQEPPMHEPRHYWTMALAYATSNRGACHVQGVPTYLEWGLMQPEYGYLEKLPAFVEEGKPEAVKFHQDFAAAYTAMGHCQFTIGGVVPFDLIAKAFSAVTGREIDHWGLLKIGERIWNLKRAFNVRMGVSEKDDILPKRFAEEPLQEGATAGRLPPMKTMLKKYYSLRGWKEGKPTKEKLEELELSKLISDLWP
jgi:aldehyde:ferredoxin oxidoreductase